MEVVDTSNPNDNRIVSPLSLPSGVMSRLIIRVISAREPPSRASGASGASGVQGLRETPCFGMYSPEHAPCMGSLFCLPKAPGRPQTRNPKP